ncbi:macro domain-containing protein [Pantoea eucalypti]|uniref:macro domain-containing protein n=1 Tax=Pantoea eucalypti TaxID=470933 RepID=UPI0024B9B8E9|nr:macro domain-containing protein [Pantoea eucalypti]MDJ0475610.1 macro domain-containing protein [Pantoea eucalypti]
MIKFVDGDFFDYEADIRINTVNCVGVMGAGVAFAFKNKYPAMFQEYASLCKRGRISPGEPVVWRQKDSNLKDLEIINFPTKNHWRNPSEYEYIQKGLIWLSEYLNSKAGKIVTLPALGCGHGGLDWTIVKKMIQDFLSESNNEILVFSPQSSKKNKREDVNHNNSHQSLRELNVSEIHAGDNNYPSGLSRFTNKNLYLVGGHQYEFDFSIISSTYPSELEKKSVYALIEIAAEKKYSILFGGSAFDKKMAAFSLSKGVRTGVFLPSGIALSAKKMNTHGILKGLSVFSLGNPFVQFNKNEYLPSVISRIFMSNKVFFTTNKLQWVRKYQKIIINNQIDSYFFIAEASDNDIDAASSIKSKAIDVQYLYAFF